MAGRERTISGSETIFVKNTYPDNPDRIGYARKSKQSNTVIPPKILIE
ncbi:hypothetical protein FACS1894111_10980 [Clostridia bacterium]|nr:hypothetical protein FACS1894111_10980 [Clostridia bacterium]